VPSLPGSGSSERIEIRDLRVLGRHGALAGEQDAPQPFGLDLTVWLDRERLGGGDDLNSTVDYGEVCTLAAGIVERERHQLLEHLAERIAEAILADGRVLAVEVGLRKLRPPIPLELSSVGVVVVRTRRAPGEGRGALDSVDQDLQTVPASGSLRGGREVLFSLGSNLGDRLGFLLAALERLRELDPAAEVSPVYETMPVGGRGEQGRYLNCVVRLSSTLPARELLAVARALEDRAGRVREERNGPRTLDVDLLYVGDERIDEVDLVVPHPRIAERSFVLAPLEDVAPSRVDNDWRDRVADGGRLHETMRLVATLATPRRTDRPADDRREEPRG
jgi:dihydroneopterin aldolase/2-amino-4-hydroxy-6-hydroxymethyldihydropteridine diphosphokinase